VHANNAGIMDIGFHHFVGCNHIDTVKLDNCVYIDDGSLQKLAYLEKTLKNLEIVNCSNVTIAGLEELKGLKHLENLKIAELKSVEDLSKIEKELKQALPNCKFDLK
jgi:ATP synthase, H+ transporting, mitochondrial F0 complex, subunit s